jgi:anthranilate synthase component 2
MHGKTCPVEHDGDALFAGIPSPLTGMRYHSLVVERSSLPADLVVTAWSGDRPKDPEIMAMRHRARPIFGVQFHPESIGTEHGKRLLGNFLRLANVTV